MVAPDSAALSLARLEGGRLMRMRASVAEGYFSFMAKVR
jgi:hypothetical protein